MATPLASPPNADQADGPQSVAAGTRTDYAILRVCVYAGAAYVVLGLLGFAVFAGFWPPPAESLSASEIGDFFRENSVDIRIGMVLMAMCGPFYFVWSAVLSKIVGRIEGPMGVLSTIELLGGLLTGLVTFTPAVIWATAAFRADSRSDEAIQLFYDYGWLFFDLTFVCSSLQSIALGVAILRDGRATPLFPSWVAWVCFLTAVTYVPLVGVPFFDSGPFAWHGLINFWAVFVMFFIMIFVVSHHAYRALRVLQAEDSGV